MSFLVYNCEMYQLKNYLCDLYRKKESRRVHLNTGESEIILMIQNNILSVRKITKQIGCPSKKYFTTMRNAEEKVLNIKEDLLIPIKNPTDFPKSKVGKTRKYISKMHFVKLDLTVKDQIRF